MTVGLEGACHCGAVRIRVAHPPREVTECRCSICRRYGALWAYYSPREVTMSGPTVDYVWGRKRIGFHHCGTCGCVMAWIALRKDYDQCGINSRMLEGFDPDAVMRIVEDDASV